MIKRILTDLRQNALPIIILAVLWTAAQFFFHHFCPVVILCGFPCPGCGLTRAFVRLFTLHPVQAFHSNPSCFLWVILITAYIIRRYVQGKGLEVLRIPLAIVCILTIGIYIYRITHCFPGEPPMVYVHGNLISRVSPEYDRIMTELFR